MADESHVIRTKQDDDLALRIYKSATDFDFAWAMLHENTVMRLQIYGYPTVPCGVPSVVIGAFCIELYLKCLLAIRSVNPNSTHDLKILFHLLPEEDRNKIRIRYDNPSVEDKKRLPDNDEDGKPFDPDYHSLKKAIRRLSQTFDNWRYSHEGKRRKLDSSGLEHLRDVLVDHIKEIMPDWPEVVTLHGAKPTFLTY